jgi:hypothetical protein
MRRSTTASWLSAPDLALIAGLARGGDDKTKASAPVFPRRQGTSETITLFNDKDPRRLRGAREIAATSGFISGRTTETSGSFKST